MGLGVKTNRKLHWLLGRLGLMGVKGELVWSYTEGRTEHSHEMTEREGRALVRKLEGMLEKRERDARRQEAESVLRMRRKVAGLCHELGWWARDARGEVVRRGGRPVLDWDRINRFFEARTVAKKPVWACDAEELRLGLVSLEKVAAWKHRKAEAGGAGGDVESEAAGV